jgi:hypothetical protein
LSNPPHRTVVETERFSKAFQQLKISAQRLDEVLVGVHQALCVEPAKCPVIEGTPLSMIKTRHFGKTPALRIFFTYTDNEVQLVHVEIIGGEQILQAAAAGK